MQRKRTKQKTRPDFTIVGAGQLARVLAHALDDGGYKVREIVARDLPESKQRARKLARQVNATATLFAAAELKAAVIWLCIPDDFIPQCAHAITRAKADWTGQIMVHSSGALSSNVLQPFSRAGGDIASAHPLMSFVPSSPATLKGVPIALEGDARAVSVVTAVLRRMRASIFSIEGERKAAYHAFGSFASPLLVAYLTQMETAGEVAGLNRRTARDRAAAILQQTLTNYLRRGPEEAFSGPLRRGDVGTIQKHLAVLQKDPRLAQFYRDLVQISLRNLPVQKGDQIRKLVE